MPADIVLPGPWASTATLPVLLGELKTTADGSGSLCCYSLGSCVAVAVYDPVTRLSAMAHVVLPQSAGRPDGPPARYADKAINAIAGVYRAQGIRLSRLVVKIAGGARILQLSNLPGKDIGTQNVAAVLASLSVYGIVPVAQHTGGTFGRTVELSASDGSVKISSVGRPAYFI